MQELKYHLPISKTILLVIFSLSFALLFFWMMMVNIKEMSWQAIIVACLIELFMIGIMVFIYRLMPQKKRLSPSLIVSYIFLVVLTIWVLRILIGDSINALIGFTFFGLSGLSLFWFRIVKFRYDIIFNQEGFTVYPSILLRPISGKWNDVEKMSARVIGMSGFIYLLIYPKKDTALFSNMTSEKRGEFEGAIAVRLNQLNKKPVVITKEISDFCSQKGIKLS